MPRRPILARNASNKQSEHSQQFLECQDYENDRLCCKKSFVQFSNVGAESIDTQYKNYQTSWKSQEKGNIAKCICAFLNTSGGTIYIGIAEKNNQRRRTVVGLHFQENQKEQLLKDIRLLCQLISPFILANSFVDVSFVPVHDKNQRPISKTFIVKISVKQGNTMELYSILNKETRQKKYFFRTWNEVICLSDANKLKEILFQRKNGTIVQKCYPHKGSCGQSFREEQIEEESKVKQKKHYIQKNKQIGVQTQKLKVFKQKQQVLQSTNDITMNQQRKQLKITGQQHLYHLYLRNHQRKEQMTCRTRLSKICTKIQRFFNRIGDYFSS